MLCIIHPSSSVDLLNEREMLEQYPLAVNTPYRDVVLKPGQMLFIPRWVWHWVGAISEDVAAAWEDDINTNTTPRYFNEYESKVTNEKDIYSWSVNFWWGPRKEKD
jgi:hypothetical protein